MKCLVCNQPFGDGEFEGISQYAAYGGLPSPACGHCFEANDFSIKNVTQLQARSLVRRSKYGGVCYDKDGEVMPVTKEDIESWKSIDSAFSEIA